MKLSAIVIAASLLGAMAAQAQEAPPSPEHLARREAAHKACATEEKNLCDGKQGREVFQCLRQQDDKLGAGCKDALGKLRPPAPAK